MARKRASKQKKEDFEKMMKKNRTRKIMLALGITAIIIISLILVALSYEEPSNNTSEPQVLIKAGDAAPLFSFTDTEDNTYELENFLGKTVLLNMIETTSCNDCILEMEQLKKVHSSYEPNEIAIITININSSDTMHQLKDFKAEYGGDWIFARDSGVIKKSYAPQNLPSTFIIDKKGIVAYPDLGLTNSKSFSSLIDTLRDVGINLGQIAPNFRLVDLAGNSFGLNDFRGRVVVIDLMATWCGPCKSEMEHLKEIFSKYSHSEVWILSIDVDDEETESQLQQFKNDYGDDWTFAAKGSGVGSMYGVSGIPQMYIIDQDGVIAYKNTGVTSASVLSSEIDKLL